MGGPGGEKKGARDVGVAILRRLVSREAGLRPGQALYEEGYRDISAEDVKRASLCR
jgi:hypothetical protein